MDETMKAFVAWDNHRQDCKATRRVKAEGGPEVSEKHPCSYTWDRCPKGQKLYDAWRKAAGFPHFANELPDVDMNNGREPGQYPGRR